MGDARGIALITALAVGGLLALLAVLLFGLFWSQRMALQRQQHVVQATWNAHSALERYLQQGHLPAGGRIEFSRGETCITRQEPNRDLVFEGSSQGVTARVVLLGADPQRRWESSP